ncbi:ornithine cyclodeaminase family protein [Pyruvatibacter sp.]|uniref:ornithine cyclodeaminase family protein n=1 Tax=Pyruvatibacter sp. TaxID=1981328 RepID=UPI0032F07FF1
MRLVTAAELSEALDVRSLMERLRSAFRDDIASPPRTIHHISSHLGDGEPGGGDLMLMPAWVKGTARAGDMRGRRGFIGVKVQAVFPENRQHKVPSLTGVYVLMSGRTGEPVGLMDAPTLTACRTAAASALAASYLARQDAQRLLMVGAGALAPHLIRAHAQARPICNVLVWNRTPATAQKLAKRLTRPDLKVAATTDLEGAVRGADIICTATGSTQPLVKGDWLQPGVHLDLVGGYRQDMREVDDTAISRARLFVDTRAGAMAEAGDITAPMEAGIISADDITADLYELARGEKAGRRYHDQITLFKSVGTALEDLAAATLAFERT